MNLERFVYVSAAILILLSALGLVIVSSSLVKIVDTRYSVQVRWDLRSLYDGDFVYNISAMVRNNGSLTVEIEEFWVFLYMLDPNPYGSGRHVYEASLGGQKYYFIWSRFVQLSKPLEPGSQVNLSASEDVSLEMISSKADTVKNILKDYGNRTPVLYLYSFLKVTVVPPGPPSSCPIQFCQIVYESGPAPKSPTYGVFG